MSIKYAPIYAIRPKHSWTGTKVDDHKKILKSIFMKNVCSSAMNIKIVLKENVPNFELLIAALL